jgi:hypothetical protein
MASAAAAESARSDMLFRSALFTTAGMSIMCLHLAPLKTLRIML